MDHTIVDIPEKGIMADAWALLTGCFGNPDVFMAWFDKQARVIGIAGRILATDPSIPPKMAVRLTPTQRVSEFIAIVRPAVELYRTKK